MITFTADCVECIISSLSIVSGSSVTRAGRVASLTSHRSLGPDLGGPRPVDLSGVCVYKMQITQRVRFSASNFYDEVNASSLKDNIIVVRMLFAAREHLKNSGGFVWNCNKIWVECIHSAAVLEFDSDTHFL